MIDWIRATLDRFGVRFDSWFSEATLEETGGIEESVKLLREAGFAYDDEGAVWFRSTAFGDDKDRVLIRGTGAPTYFAKDVAYFRNKFARGFDRLVYVWGADHHGDVTRVRGAAQALGYEPDAMEFVLYQFVSLYRAGEAVKMSKRAGDLITLDELLDEVGPDAARYTLLSRSSDSRDRLRHRGRHAPDDGQSRLLRAVRARAYREPAARRAGARRAIAAVAGRGPGRPDRTG